MSSQIDRFFANHFSCSVCVVASFRVVCLVFMCLKL